MKDRKRKTNAKNSPGGSAEYALDHEPVVIKPDAIQTHSMEPTLAKFAANWSPEYAIEMAEVYERWAVQLRCAVRQAVLRTRLESRKRELLALN